MRSIIFILFFAVQGFSTIDFSNLIYDYSGIPEIQHYRALDGAMLDYRYYPSGSKDLMIILHGSGYHSRYLYKLAKALSDGQIVQVVTPDLRGHGIKPLKRGDVNYIGQLDDDLDDLVEFCSTSFHPNKIYIAGHSSGGGLALRLMGNHQRWQADGYLLFAPYLAHNALTTSAKSGWAKSSLVKIVLAHMLNAFGFHCLDHLVTIKFDMPKRYRDESETLDYTHALITSFSPSDYKSDLLNTSKDTLVAVGEDDEANARAYQEVLPKSHFKLFILAKVNHMGIITDDKVVGVITGWLNS